MRTLVSRRHFLVSSIAIFATTLCGGLLLRRFGILSRFSNSKARQINSLLDFVALNGYVEVLGEKCLESGESVSDQQIRQYLSDRLRSLPLRSAGLEGRELFDWLVKSDYEQGQTVNVVGWVISESEAKIYSLYKLSRVSQH